MSITGGNTRLGNIDQLSIPAKRTCPGMTAACSGVCYADRGLYQMPSVARSLEATRILTESDRFVDWAIASIVSRNSKVFRIHCSGDFYSSAYAKKWLTIVRRRRTTFFYAYTRSWRAGLGMEQVLMDLAIQQNMRLWLSCDKDTGRPPAWHRSRSAYLSLDDGDWPDYSVDLVFRNNPRTAVKWQPGAAALVCPKEQGVERQVAITCEKCMLCFTGRKIPARKSLLVL